MLLVLLDLSLQDVDFAFHLPKDEDTITCSVNATLCRTSTDGGSNIIRPTQQSVAIGTHARFGANEFTTDSIGNVLALACMHCTAQ